MVWGFYGHGFPHPDVECFIAQLNKLLTHCGCSLGLSIRMQALMEFRITEGGVSAHILSENFHQCSKWVTHSWLRSVWEKVDQFRLRVEIYELPLKFPRENDKWMMLAFKQMEYSDNKLVCLNPVCCYWQVMFYSDIFDTGGKALDRWYLVRCPPQDTWSTLICPQEHPPAKDFWLWTPTLESITSRGRPQHHLGHLVNRGHNIWTCWYDKEKLHLHHPQGPIMDNYTPSINPGQVQRPNQWACTRAD